MVNAVVSLGLLAYDFDSRMWNGVDLGPMALHEGFCFCAAGVVLGLTATGGWCFEECFVGLKTDDESCCPRAAGVAPGLVRDAAPTIRGSSVSRPMMRDAAPGLLKDCLVEFGMLQAK